MLRSAVCCSTDACRSSIQAAKRGHLYCLQWSYRQYGNLRWDDFGPDFDAANYLCCETAALYGHLDVLQWAHQHGCPCGPTTCSAAAKGGHLEVLQWAHSNGCGWDASTCSSAAAEGHLAVLQWAREHGCAWDGAVVARAHDVEVLIFAYDNGAPMDRAAKHHWQLINVVLARRQELRVCFAWAAYKAARGVSPSACLRAMAAVPVDVVLVIAGSVRC